MRLESEQSTTEIHEGVLSLLTSNFKSLQIELGPPEVSVGLPPPAPLLDSLPTTSSLRTGMAAHDVLIIGSGLSALTAARALKTYKPVLLEARTRVGGRALTWTEGLEQPVDAGCSMVHGYAEGNPLRGILREYGIVSSRLPPCVLGRPGPLIATALTVRPGQSVGCSHCQGSRGASRRRQWRSVTRSRWGSPRRLRSDGLHAHHPCTSSYDLARVSSTPTSRLSRAHRPGTNDRDRRRRQARRHRSPVVGFRARARRHRCFPRWWLPEGPK